MRPGLLMVFAVAVVAGGAAGQPKDGDLVLAANRLYQPLDSPVVYLDPARPGVLTTLASIKRVNNMSRFAQIRMAANNHDLVVCNQDPLSRSLITVTPAGVLTSINVTSLPGNPTDLELDHDGVWAVTMNDQNRILGGVSNSDGSVMTFWSSTASPPLDALAIDRDPNMPEYCLGPRTINSQWYVLTADRGRSPGTLVVRNANSLDLIELDPRTGDYIVADTAPSPYAVRLLRIRKSGKVATVYQRAGYAVNFESARIMQNGNIWLAPGLEMLELDLSNGAVVRSLPLPVSYIEGLEVYGYRRLVCCQPPSSPTTVTVNVQSRNAAAPGASYILAASFARRPGMSFANGEWLDLNIADPLFLATASDHLPGIFQGFRGTLDPNGNATAKVVVPPGLPRLNDMAIFVAGVIYTGPNIIQVTNTHWFVLP
jgi:hypothetical protein